MTEPYPPLKATNFRYEHQGVHFFLRIKQLPDGRWDAWVCYQGMQSIVIDHDVGMFAEWDAAHEAGLVKAKELIENAATAAEQRLGA